MASNIVELISKSDIDNLLLKINGQYSDSSNSLLKIKSIQHGIIGTISSSIKGITSPQGISISQVDPSKCIVVLGTTMYQSSGTYTSNTYPWCLAHRFMNDNNSLFLYKLCSSANDTGNSPTFVSVMWKIVEFE